ncbi:5'-nucleotidase [Spirochaetia bacterium]|nr:5'-nucleotidase [Spirochaetia bacterium]
MAAYPIEKKLVVGISTTALFDLEKEDEIFRKDGINSFKKYEYENKNKLISKGLAFPFIKRFLNINNVFKEQQPVEVVLLSKNSADSGIRIFNSIKHYSLNITRAAFTAGKNPSDYIPAFNISLFLSTNKNDVDDAISKNYPAGVLLKSKVHDDEKDMELRVAFDFDGVLVDDSSEAINQKDGLELFMEHEENLKDEPISAGLMKDFFTKLSGFQKLESKRLEKDPEYKKILHTAIVTARNSPSHERAINTLKSWDVDVDSMFFLGGIEKKRILSVLKPHLFIDDQKSHLDSSLEDVALVHVPFGAINKE